MTMKEHSHTAWFHITGFFGAAIYFINQADGFWASVLGILKAMIWPAFLVYKLFIFIS